MPKSSTAVIVGAFSDRALLRASIVFALSRITWLTFFHMSSWAEVILSRV